MRRPLTVGLLVVMVTVVAGTAISSNTPADAATAPYTISMVDGGLDYGYFDYHTSLALDASGNPVISFFDGNKSLKLAHCNDPDCAGGDDSVEVVDFTGQFRLGLYSSLQLDGSGYPVVSYYVNDGNDIKVARCNDPNCAGGDESIVTIDDAGNFGGFTSLELDGDGFPVVSYHGGLGGSADQLRVAHCNDALCTGGDESIEVVDSSSGSVGLFTSLELDADGFPVVSYHDETNGRLRLAHCNDPNCAGGDESLRTVDSGQDRGQQTSLVMDGSGLPVISYLDNHLEEVRVARCNDANCGGGNESIEIVMAAGSVGGATSIQLGAGGKPVIAYGAAGLVWLGACNDKKCAGGDETLVPIDDPLHAWPGPSLQLDADDNPLMAYSRAYEVIDEPGPPEPNAVLLAHCTAPACDADPTPPVVSASVTGTMGDNGWYKSQVRVEWTASDPESQVHKTGCGVSYLGQGAGQTLTCQARSAGGTTTETVTIDIDRHGPRTTLSGVQSGKSYPALPQMKCTTTDPLSGVAKHAKLQIEGSSSRIGPLTARCKGGTDKAGNKQSRDDHKSFVVAPTAQPSCVPASNPWPREVVNGFSTTSGDGYWLVHRDGTVTVEGDARFGGDASCLGLTGPILGGAATADGYGYWLNAFDGGVFSFDSAEFFGSMGGTPLNQPVFSMAPTVSGAGYWLVAYDGGIFSFGDAAFYGSTGDLALVQPINGITTSPSGKGYRMVARDGGIFNFGDVDYYGSLPALGVIVSDVAGMAPTPTGEGYWVVRANGEVYAFGDALDFGDYSPVSGESVVAIFSNPAPEGFTQGYRLVLSTGVTVGFGDPPG